jgi:hypothetical protein
MTGISHLLPCKEAIDTSTRTKVEYGLAWLE